MREVWVWTSTTSFLGSQQWALQCGACGWQHVSHALGTVGHVPAVWDSACHGHVEM